MDPTPPKSQRHRKLVNRPFYEPTSKTSAEIISEARSTVRALETKRPSTPAEHNRTLFSKDGKKREGRPSSAVSIASSYTESRPHTGKRLTPLSNVPDFEELQAKLKVFDEDKNNNKLDKMRANDQKPHIKSSIIPKSFEPTFSRTRSAKSKNRISSPKVSDEQTRRVHSGPKERTPLLDGAMNNELQRSSSFGDVSSNTSNSSISKASESSSNASEAVASDTASIYYEQNVSPLIQQIHLNHEYGDYESLVTNYDVLYETLKIGNMLGKSALGNKRRSNLLNVVIKSAGSHPMLQLKICRIFLAFEVSGKNMETICKLMFTISRDKKHDKEFLKEQLIGPIIQLIMEPAKLNVVDCLVYLTGTIKFLTLNQQCLQEMIKQKALKAIKILLEFTKDKLSGNSKNNKESCHMLVQVTSALGNFANVTTLIGKFLENDILQLLLDLMKTRMDDPDYIMNVSRVFSKLTISEAICKNVTKQDSNSGILMRALVLHIKKKEIAVRLCYAFGNLSNHIEDVRNQLVSQYDGIKVFVDVAGYYYKYLAKNTTTKEDRNKVLDQEDVLIKVIRVIANTSIDRACGKAFADNEECVLILLKILEGHESLQCCDELLINTAATINNLSFYSNEESALMKYDEQLSSAFLQMLLLENSECAVEAMRALGNFTKNSNVREFLANEKGLEVIITLLESCDWDMIFCTCGVLINMMVDLSTRPTIKKLDGITRLVNLMREIGEKDWCLQALICQVLWNYSETITTSTECFGEEEADDLIIILNEFLEPELALNYENEDDLDDDVIEYLKESWEKQFQPVALLLLDRIEQHHSNLEPLNTPPD